MVTSSLVHWILHADYFYTDILYFVRYLLAVIIYWL